MTAMAEAKGISDSGSRRGSHAITTEDVVLKVVQIYKEKHTERKGPMHTELVRELSEQLGIQQFTAQHMVKTTHDELVEKGLLSTGYELLENGSSIMVYLITPKGQERAAKINLNR